MTHGIYDADGKIRMTLSPGSGFVGLYAPDGSWYVTVAPGDSYVGAYAPDGSLYITDATGSSTVGLRAPDGSLRVTLGSDENGALKVSGISTAAPSGPGGVGSPMGLLLLLTYSQESGSILLEDGASILLLEDNVSELLLEL